MSFLRASARLESRAAAESAAAIATVTRIEPNGFRACRRIGE